MYSDDENGIFAHSSCLFLEAMAEFERSLIQERVRAGLRNAKLKGKTLGRPRRIVSANEVTRLRGLGLSFREIGMALGASPGTVRARMLRRVMHP